MSRLSISFPDRAHFSMSQTVRIQDINYRKHLGHDKLISMLHEARAAFFESIGMPELDDSPEGYILADLQIQYLDEAFLGESLTFEIAVSETSNRSCQLLYQVSKYSSEPNHSNKHNHTVITARAKTGIVFYDYDLKQARTLPTELAELTL